MDAFTVESCVPKHNRYGSWIQLLFLDTESDLWGRVLGEAEKNNFTALPGKEGLSRLLSSKPLCPDLERVVRSFTGMVQRGRGQLVGSLLIGWWWGKWESASSAFWFHQVWGLVPVGSTQLTPPTWWGFQYLWNSSNIFCICLERVDQDLPKAALLFLLTIIPLLPHPLPSIISIHLNLFLGTQEGLGGWMKPISYNQERGI